MKWTTEGLVQKLKKKHLCILGGTAEQRIRWIDDICVIMNWQSYHFPATLPTSEDYFHWVDRLFPYKIVDWHGKKKWSTAQIYDFHLDWLHGNYHNLIVLKEFYQMEADWNLEILRDYFQQSYQLQDQKAGPANFRLIFSLPEEGDLISQLAKRLQLPATEKRSAVQVLLGSIAFIDLG